MKRLIKYKTEDFTEGAVFGYNLYVARELEIDTPDFETLYKVMDVLEGAYSKLVIQSIENLSEAKELPHYVRTKPKKDKK